MKDEDFMKIAFWEARKARKRNDYPIGAVLVIDGKIVASEGNKSLTNKDRNSHAESLLIKNNASLIKKSHDIGRKITIYTTLEPCIMCFGACIQNKINRVVYACPDPVAGAARLKPFTKWLEERWPSLEQGPLEKEMFEYFYKYMKENKKVWKKIIPYFEKLKKSLLRRQNPSKYF